MVKVTYRKMKDAPRDKLVFLRVRGRGEVLAYYADCKWLREPFMGQPGDKAVTDCWRADDGSGDIELADALGWRPY